MEKPELPHPSKSKKKKRKKENVCEMDLKLAMLRKILLIIMMSFYQNVCLSKRLTVVVAFA